MENICTKKREKKEKRVGVDHFSLKGFDSAAVLAVSHRESLVNEFNHYLVTLISITTTISQHSGLDFACDANLV